MVWPQTILNSVSGLVCGIQNKLQQSILSKRPNLWLLDSLLIIHHRHRHHHSPHPDKNCTASQERQQGSLNPILDNYIRASQTTILDHPRQLSLAILDYYCTGWYRMAGKSLSLLLSLESNLLARTFCHNLNDNTTQHNLNTVVGLDMKILCTHHPTHHTNSTVAFGLTFIDHN